MSKFYCLIPAKRGSEGIPRKNIKILNVMVGYCTFNSMCKEIEGIRRSLCQYR